MLKRGGVRVCRYAACALRRKALIDESRTSAAALRATRGAQMRADTDVAQARVWRGGKDMCSDVRKRRRVVPRAQRVLTIRTGARAARDVARCARARVIAACALSLSTTLQMAIPLYRQIPSRCCLFFLPAAADIRLLDVAITCPCLISRASFA